MQLLHGNCAKLQKELEVAFPCGFGLAGEPGGTRGSAESSGGYERPP